jgi:protease-4
VLEGLGRYRLYYREGLQDKLGVDVHLFRVGEYKSAAEPYILDAASPESREADLFWMNDLWSRYLDEVAQARASSSARTSTRWSTRCPSACRRARATWPSSRWTPSWSTA